MPLPDTITGREFREIVAPGADTIQGLLEGLMSTTGTLDALFQNLAARNDPTIPRLINSQLQTFADQKNTGGFDANAFLSGDFSRAAPSNPTTLGAGTDSPFDIPFQEAGVNPIIEFLINSVIGPITVDSLQGIRDILFQVGPSPITAGGGRDNPGTTIPDEGTLQDLQDQFNNILGGNQGASQILNGGGSESSPIAPSPVSGGALGPGLPPPTLQAPPAASGGLPAPNPIDDILQQALQPQLAQQNPFGAGTPILGSFQHGGVVPQTGLFQLEQGEQVIPAGGIAGGGINVPNLPGNAPGALPIQPASTSFAPPPPPPQPVPVQAALPTNAPDGGIAAGGTQPFNPPNLPGNALEDLRGGIAAGGTQPNPPPPGLTSQDQAAPNPLQQAIDSLRGIVQGGGPLQQNINDQFSNQLLSSRRNVAEDFGRRGLGGSGIQEQLGLQAELGIFNNATRASNDLALSGAQALGGLSLGAGQFGLQQQQLQFQQTQSLFESLLRAIQGSAANPGEGVPTTNVNII